MNLTSRNFNLIIKIIALLIFIFLTNQGFKFRLDYLIETKNYTTIVVFTILWVFSILVLLITAFQPNWLIRVFWAFVIAITTAVSYGFYAAGGSELEVLDILELWQARHETGRALEFFQHAVVKAGIVALLGFFIIAYPAPSISYKAKRLFSLFFWLPLVPIALFFALIFIKSDRAVAGLPQQLSPISMASAVAYKLTSDEIPEREDVKEIPQNSPKIKHLVYLVDESINPNYLYSEDGKLLNSFKQNSNKIANFGTSVSGSNCSARSNAILRLGATRDNLIDTIRTRPTIWQYAKKAGYRTIYIDSQDSDKTVTKPNDFQNYMTSEEAKLIDKFYKVKDTPSPELDYRLLEIMTRELQHSVPTFIYANKNGAHFPYSDNYPESAAIFQPVTSAIKDKDAKLSSLLEFYKNDSLQAVINTYKNSIYWNVDKFFEKLFSNIDLKDTLIIYTSDHGQYFETGKTTHCTSGDDAPATEGLVPLLVITDKQPLLQQFVKSSMSNYNLTDQFSIFPTVLALFGYSEEEQAQYGNNLLEPVNSKTAAFNTGDILGIISKDTIWRRVDLEERINLVPNAPPQPPVPNPPPQ